MEISKSMFLEFITDTIAKEGWKVADNANKIALSMERISVDTYSAAAKLIVKAYLAQ